MPKTRGQKDLGTGRFEQLAATLLLCANSELQDAWTGSDNSNDWKKELDTTGLSGNLKQAIFEFMDDFRDFRTVFKGVGITTRGLYSGGEPHPGRKETQQVVEALQALDKKSMKKNKKNKK